MEMLFLKALFAGVAIAAPIGPMALLCIRRTIDDGWHAGFATGAGIATGDALLAVVAASGLTAVSHLLMGHERLLHIAAAPLLIYLGVRAVLDRRAVGKPSATFSSLGSAYINSTLLTLANPPTLLAFAALFAFIARTSSASATGAFAMVCGVTAGSLLWWFALTGGVALARRSVTPRVRAYVSAISGVALAGFGVALLLS